MSPRARRGGPSAATVELLAALTGRFEAHRDPERAARMAAYMRDRFAFVGIPSPLRVTLQRDAIDRSASLPPDELGDFALAAWARDEREYQYAACWLLRRRTTVLSSAFLPTAEQLITTKSWWDTVDELATHVVGDIVRADPESRMVMDRWLVHDDLWLARTAILHQERWKADTDADWLFAACLRRAGDRDFFLRKAIGWALRSYSYVDPGAVERFVAEHATSLSGLSKHEALKAIERTRTRAGGA